MKKNALLCLIISTYFNMYSQEYKDTGFPPIQSISSDNNVSYRLFATKDINTFIKLNTKNGKLSQIHWSLKDNLKFEKKISDKSLVKIEDEVNGRFFLYATANIYVFILLDQLSGKTWQVQWGRLSDRNVVPIEDLKF